MPVAELRFSHPVMLPGRSGATNLVTTSEGAGYGATRVDSILLYRGEFIVDGGFFIPKTAGALLGWSF